MATGPEPSSGLAEGPLLPTPRPGRPPVLVQLDAALADERAAINGVFEQRAAELLHRAVGGTAGGVANPPAGAADGASPPNGGPRC